MKRTMNATDFKAKCLAVLDDVARTGRGVTILKRGRPVAELVATVSSDGARYPQQTLVKTVTLLGDIVGPPLPADAWEAEGDRREDPR
jgi:antitoxin (DNA-binding transcriptional repressor) of toxin-antitoxin stability system